jgi:DeoR/GlpR family transcriptional regulator of sugar metabolism
VNPQERREQILAWLAHGAARVDELAGMLDVTESTIRRDLIHLREQGHIVRTYGGAVVGPPASPVAEQSLDERAVLARREKDAIARHATRYVTSARTILLDAGTTTGRLAHHLVHARGLTVATNGLTALAELARAEDVEVIVLGGRLRHVSQGLVGPITEQVLRRITAQAAFLGADGLVAGRGICEADASQTWLKELMAAQAERVYVLADSSKLGHAPFDVWAPLDLPWTLITDDGAAEEQLEQFRALPQASVDVVPVQRKPGPRQAGTAT